MAALYCLNQVYHQYQIGVNINDSAATAQIVVEISCKFKVLSIFLSHYVLFHRNLSIDEEASHCQSRECILSK
jgi:hypothetical protein